jgi:hypothetical protein
VGIIPGEFRQPEDAIRQPPAESLRGILAEEDLGKKEGKILTVTIWLSLTQSSKASSKEAAGSLGKEMLGVRYEALNSVRPVPPFLNNFFFNHFPFS